MILTCIGTIGYRHYSNKVNQEKEQAASTQAVQNKELLRDIAGYQKEQEKLLLLQEDPVIKISPDSSVRGELGSFELSLLNCGLSDVREIGIFEDYFVALAEKNMPLKLFRFGIFLTKPNTIIKTLPKKQDIKFRIEFPKTLTEMTKFYLDKNIPGQRMMVARIKINYTREIDGKVFSYMKAFIIAGHGDLLLDYDSSREIKPDILSFSFDEVKEAMGITQ